VRREIGVVSPEYQETLIMSTSTIVISNPPPDAHIAPCGLFCTHCGKFKKGGCPGCQIKPGFSKCAIRRCVIEKRIVTCAECEEFRAPRDFKECPKINNLLARIIALFTKSNRPGSLAVLRDEGPDAYLEVKRTSGRM
jgi:hypothetical protein